MADLQRARQHRAHHRLRSRRRSDGDHACGAGRNNGLQRLLSLEGKNENRAKYAQKYMDKWAEKYGPEAAARIAEIVLKD